METIHHLYIARLKDYIDEAIYCAFRERYLECVRMLNGLEKTLERNLATSERRWPTSPEPQTPSLSHPFRARADVSDDHALQFPSDVAEDDDAPFGIVDGAEERDALDDGFLHRRQDGADVCK